MTKKHQKSDSSQLSLLDLIQRAQELNDSPTTQGSANIERELRIAIGAAIKECPLSVHQIAGEMSHLLAETITAEMIYSWTAESKTHHQAWGSRLPALCIVTGCRRPMEIMARAAGMFCLPGPDALRAEIQRFTEAERLARAERRKREVFLSEIESK